MATSRSFRRTVSADLRSCTSSADVLLRCARTPQEVRAVTGVTPLSDRRRAAPAWGSRVRIAERMLTEQQAFRAARDFIEHFNDTERSDGLTLVVACTCTT